MEVDWEVLTAEEKGSWVEEVGEGDEIGLEGRKGDDP